MKPMSLQKFVELLTAEVQKLSAEEKRKLREKIQESFRKSTVIEQRLFDLGGPTTPEWVN